MKHLLLGLLTLASVSPAAAADQRIEIKVTEEGFVPSSIDVTPGSTVTLDVTRTTDSTCSTQIQVPSKKIKKDLPLNKSVQIALGKLEKGEIRFGCGMNMMDGGKINVK